MLDTLTNYDQLTSTSSTYLNHSLTHHQSSPVTCHHSSDLRRPDGGLRAAETWGPSNRSRPVCKARSKLLISTWRGATIRNKLEHFKIKTIWLMAIQISSNSQSQIDGWTMLNNVEQCWTMIQYTTIYDEQVQWRMTKWELTWWAELSCSSFAMRFFHSCIRYQRKNKGKQWQTSKWCIFLLT